MKAVLQQRWGGVRAAWERHGGGVSLRAECCGLGAECARGAAWRRCGGGVGAAWE